MSTTETMNKVTVHNTNLHYITIHFHFLRTTIRYTYTYITYNAESYCYDS